MRHAMPPPPTMPRPDEHPLPVFRPSGTALLNIALIVLALVALVVLSVRRDGNAEGIEVQRRNAPAGVDEIRVQVSGAVAAPGVVEALPGDRVVDVIERVGGPLPDADLDGVNLALRVRDEDVIRVPFRGESAMLGLIDLNTATQAELEELPGIGPARARQIIAARPLASADELIDRDLIPASVWEEIRLLVTTR